MDQKKAQKLFNEGGFLILSGVPEGTEFGMDWNSWTTGPRFEGVKMIPPGFHFIFYSSTSKYGGHGSPRTGICHYFTRGEIVVGKWDAFQEDVMLQSKSDSEMESIRENIRMLDKNLAPYPYESLHKWVSLTDHISSAVLKKLQPQNGKILSVPELVPLRDDDVSELEPVTSSGMKKMSLESAKTSAVSASIPELVDVPQNDMPSESHVMTSEEPARSSDQSMMTSAHAESNSTASNTGYTKSRHGVVDKDGLPVLKSIPGTEIRFTRIPKVWYPPNSTPREISKHSMDSSYVLSEILKNCEEPVDLLSELQFTFICFVLGQVLDAFEHWKKLVHVICSCNEFMKSNSKLFNNLLTVLYHQVNEIPSDFFVDVVSSNNFLVTTLSNLFAGLESSEIEEGLRKRAKQYRKYLTKKFKWDFKSEPDDWAPVVVETSS